MSHCVWLHWRHVAANWAQNWPYLISSIFVSFFVVLSWFRVLLREGKILVGLGPTVGSSHLADSWTDIKHQVCHLRPDNPQHSPSQQTQIHKVSQKSRTRVTLSNNCQLANLVHVNNLRCTRINTKIFTYTLHPSLALAKCLKQRTSWSFLVVARTEPSAQ